MGNCMFQKYDFKETHKNNNGIHVIFNMAAIIHHLPLNKLKSKICKTERINILDYFIKFKLQERHYQAKGGCCFFLEVEEEANSKHSKDA